MATYFEDKKTRVILKGEGEHMENKITERQIKLLVKLGATESKIKNLSVKEASIMIRDLISKQEKGEEVVVKQPTKKATTKAKATEPKQEAKKETSKKETATKVAETKATTNTKETKSSCDHALVEQLTQAIKVAYNGELKKELSFLQESKIDELAVFIIEYAKKNAKSGGFGLDTRTLIDLANKFAKQSKDIFTFNFDTKVETEVKAETPKVAKATTKKATSSSTTTKVAKETKKANDKLQKDIFIQQSFEALLQKMGK